MSKIVLIGLRYSYWSKIFYNRLSPMKLVIILGWSMILMIYILAKDAMDKVGMLAILRQLYMNILTLYNLWNLL